MQEYRSEISKNMLTIKAQRIVNRMFKMVLILLTAMGVTLNFTSVSAALEPDAFEISLEAEAEYAVPGEAFTYLVTVTNTGQEPVRNVLVIVEIPEGTAFIETVYTNVNWYGGNSNLATDITEVKWFTVEPVQPNEVITFELMVRVSPEKANGEIVLKNYGIAIDSTELIIFGSPVRSRVVALPTPTSTPTLLPTPTHTAQIATIAPEPTGTFTPIPDASGVDDDTFQNEQPVNNQTVITPDEKSGFSNGLLIAGILALVLVTVLGFWFFKNLQG